MTPAAETAPLTVEFIGTEIVCTESLTFGRTAELVIDEANGYMHRVVGSFDVRGGAWWLTNCGSSIRLRLTGSDGLRVDLPAGTTTALSALRGSVTFDAGPATYEIGYHLPGAPDPTVAPSRPVRPVREATEGTGTVQFGDPLTPRETDFMVEFARPVLTGIGVAPTYADVAAKYGVSEKTVDNTLQNLRRKLKEAGVRGVTSLETLIDHLVSTGKITIDQVAERDSN